MENTEKELSFKFYGTTHDYSKLLYLVNAKEKESLKNIVHLSSRLNINDRKELNKFLLALGGCKTTNVA